MLGSGRAPLPSPVFLSPVLPQKPGAAYLRSHRFGRRNNPSATTQFPLPQPYSIGQALTALRPADAKEFGRRLASWPQMLKTLVFEPQSTH
jgi:hypothetical protein